MHRKLLSIIVGFSLTIAGLSACGWNGLPPGSPGSPSPQPTATPTTPATDRRPVLFVHGGAGSGSQFETPARRFAVNGYPAGHVDAIDYDSTFATETLDQVHARLDAKIEEMLRKTGADKVELVAHSLGTFVSQAYLNSSPTRAARVAHYVNLDGATALSQPGGVPTLAVWAEGDPSRSIVGATNVQFADHGHTESVTSEKTFAAMYRFFTGSEPQTTEIPVKAGKIELAGRAVLFPTNAGVAGGRLEVYQVDPQTGARVDSKPAASFDLPADGSFGPFAASGDAHYEFTLLRSGAPTHHFYYQPFRQDDRLIRLLASPPEGGLGGRMETSPKQTNLTISRFREWWGDQNGGVAGGDAGGALNDVLLVNGQNVLNAANAPRQKRVIGIFLYDRNTDGVTDLTAPIQNFFEVVFMTGMDVFIPSGEKPISVVAKPRSRGGHSDVVNVPAWPSSEHRVSIQFNDYS